MAIVKYTNKVDKSVLVDVLTYETKKDMLDDIRDFKSLHDVSKIECYKLEEFDCETTN